MLYVIARTASKRPTLMHVVGIASRTACGLDISYWSRAYVDHPLSQIMCLRCTRVTGPLPPSATTVVPVVSESLQAEYDRLVGVRHD